jgi:uncharacterized membrane protein
MSYVVEAAVGIEDKSTTVSRGWTRVEPGQCQTVVEGRIDGQRFFVHARALPAYGASPLPQSGDADLCVGQDSFAIPAATRGCTRSGQRFVRFAEVKPTETESGFKAYVAEEAEYTDEQARLAGIQRLLVLAGYDANPIDGLRGPKTDAALAQFLKERKLPAEAANSAGFFDLLLDTAQRPGTSGLTWCNDTAYRVMAAVGFDGKDSIVTRGWYRIEPGKCTRPDVDATSRLYSYAEAVDADGRAVKRGGGSLSWGGNVTLCTRVASFDFDDQQDCAARGLTATPFEAAAGGATIRFKEK